MTKGRMPEWEVREWIELGSHTTSAEIGEYPPKRTLEGRLKEGVFIADKVWGPPSSQITAWVREILQVEKVGHSGTLDPHASGILPIVYGPITKTLCGLEGAHKEYVGVLVLEEEKGEDEVIAAFAAFLGENTQIPPEHASVARKKRIRRVLELEVLQVEGKQVVFRVRSESGFYVRVLCRQVAERLGTRGVLGDLRRTRFARFTEDDGVPITTLRDEMAFYREGKENRLKEILLPKEVLFRHWKQVGIKDSAVGAVCFGAPLSVKGVARLHEGIIEGDRVAVMTLKGELVAVGRALVSSDEISQASSGLVVQTDRVFMDRNRYPRGW